MRLIRAAVSVAVMTGVTAVALQLSSGPAAADSAALLPSTSVGDLVVDGAHQRIFLSDPAGGRVITTNYAGKVLATASGFMGVRDLMLSDRLYAAVPDAGTIVAFDPATSARVATYDTGGTPRTLAAAAGKIWFGEDRKGLGSLDLSGPQPVVVHREGIPAYGSLADGGNWWLDAPKIVSSPTNPDLIATLELGSSSSTLGLLDVSTDPPTLVGHRATEGGGVDLAFSPDGSRLVVNASRGRVTAWSSTDLSTIESYEATGAFPRTVAVRDDGTVAVVVEGKSTYEDNIALYTPGTATATRELDLQQARDAGGVPIPLNLTSAARVLAWEPGGTRLFGVAVKLPGSVSQPDPILSLQVLNDPVKKPVMINIWPPTKAEVGEAYTVTGMVPSELAGLPLVITHTDPSTPGGRRVGPETVPPSGTFEFQDVQTVAGKVTYTISFPGSDLYAAASETNWLDVATTRPTTLTLDRNGSTWAAGVTVTFTAKLGATHQVREVQIFADPAGSDQPKRRVRADNVDSKGILTASIKLTRNTTVTAVFIGDDFTPAKSVTSTVYTRASVATAVTRHYKSGKIGSTSYYYYYFRRTTNPVFTSTINPYPGRKQYQQIDVWKGGKWVVWGKGYYGLSSAGKAVRELKGTHSTGVRYRVRSAYISGKSGDSANATAYGPYRYFTFTK
ncbi:hypothetical protein [Actinoplanes regularis]|uniref:hypothetical protein n=1 Tax=Actinoplanes regularis TaxID=52697 RepID=UPI00249FE565|nr:hypothetical protein [Actinoplanes regularis]GLW30047.1 hypothetical protein Areg01_29870 [Actinoplanes regularis]